MQRLEEIQLVAQQVAAYYVRTLPWASSHVADLVQEATLAVLQAAERYDSALGDFHAYAYQAGVRGARRYLQRFRAAVPAPRPERGGVAHDSVAIDDVAAKLATLFTSPSALPDVQLDAVRVAHRVRLALRRLDGSVRKQGLRVLLDGKSPADVRRKGQPMKQVRYAVKNLSRRAQRSTALRTLWQEFQP
jgi:DNA-directed RNA polymerase specialized sigma24 family protein